MKIIPVIDIKESKAVHAVRGERDRYKPLKSVFSKSSDPYEIAVKMPYDLIYVADLDKILQKGNNFKIIKKIAKKKNVMADIGIRTYEDFKKAIKLKVKPVVGSETIKSFDELKEIVASGIDFIFSIDIKKYSVLTNFLPRNYVDCFNLLKDLGVRKFIFLNLDRVGTLSGWNIDLNFLNEVPERMEIYVGGGIKKGDIEKLKNIKHVSGFLLGTAIHKGLI